MKFGFTEATSSYSKIQCDFGGVKSRIVRLNLINLFIQIIGIFVMVVLENFLDTFVSIEYLIYGLEGFSMILCFLTYYNILYRKVVVFRNLITYS